MRGAVWGDARDGAGRYHRAVGRTGTPPIGVYHETSSRAVHDPGDHDRGGAGGPLDVAHGVAALLRGPGDRTRPAVHADLRGDAWVAGVAGVGTAQSRVGRPRAGRRWDARRGSHHRGRTARVGRPGTTIRPQAPVPQGHGPQVSRFGRPTVARDPGRPDSTWGPPGS